MKRKNVFTTLEVNTIKQLIADKLQAPPGKQKVIRQRIRDIGFYYSDFITPSEGYTVAGFEELIQSGQIGVIDGNLLGTETIDKPRLLNNPNAIVGNTTIANAVYDQLSFNDIEDLKKAGFNGFKKISDLFTNCSCIPPVKGVYMVLSVDNQAPKFLNLGSGPPLYKKKTNPNVSIEELESNWVSDTIVVNIGKAGGKNQKGIEGNATLRSRLSTYFSFGQGKDVGHYGGRLIWQLKNSRDLLVCWKTTPGQEPREIENDLIKRFVSYYGQRPFANLQD